MRSYLGVINEGLYTHIHTPINIKRIRYYRYYLTSVILCNTIVISFVIPYKEEHMYKDKEKQRKAIAEAVKRHRQTKRKEQKDITVIPEIPSVSNETTKYNILRDEVFINAEERLTYTQGLLNVVVEYIKGQSYEFRRLVDEYAENNS